MSNVKNSIYLSEELQNYLEEECKTFGMGKSPFISMVLTFYKQQTQVKSEIDKFESYMQRIETLIEKQSKNKSN